MADFAAVLKKTIDGLRDNTPEMRRRVYDKARATIETKLAAVSPPPPATLADRQRRHLEDAIATVEAEYAAPAAPDLLMPDLEESDGLDRLLADLDPRTIRPAPAPLPPFLDEPARGVPAFTNLSAPQPGYAIDEDESEEPIGTSDDDLPPWMAEREEQRYVTPSSRRRRPRRAGPIVAAIVILLVVAGGAAAWFNRDSLNALPGYETVAAALGGNEDSAATATDEPASTPVAQEPSANEDKPAETQTARADTDGGEAADDAGTPASAQKFTQRLTESGDEVDEGPAGEDPAVGEGTSVASASEAGSGDAAEGAANAAPGTAGAGAAASAANGEQLAVGQKAIFYEERTNAAQGSAETGSIVWSLVQESPGDDLPAEPAIRGEATIPGKDLQLRITIKRNADQSLPASHIVEMIFLTPDDFEGGGIENVLRISMKQSEQDTGNPLLGIPAKIADGFFLFALNDSKAEEQTNLLLMRRQQWIDIPLVYNSGRRALITMEKGVPGEKVFEQALEAWSKESSG